MDRNQCSGWSGIRTLYQRLSPRGDRLSVSRSGQIWIFDVDGGSGRPLANSPSGKYVPVWTLDGQRVTFGDYASGTPNLAWRAEDGSDEIVTLLSSPYRHYPASWFDSETLVFVEVHPQTRGNVLTLRITDTEPEVVPFLSTENDESAPRLSPDGRWLAYASNETGSYRVYVRRFPEGDMLREISPDRGEEPVWSPDGRELFYRNGTQMMAAAIGSGATLTVGEPQTLFEGAYAPAACCVAGYGVSADGRYFLMHYLNNPTELKVVQNWFNELKDRVPVP